MQDGRQNEKNPSVRNELTIHLHCKWNGKVAHHSGKPLNSFLNVKFVFTVSLKLFNLEKLKKLCEHS